MNSNVASANCEVILGGHRFHYLINILFGATAKRTNPPNPHEILSRRSCRSRPVSPMEITILIATLGLEDHLFLLEMAKNSSFFL